MDEHASTRLTLTTRHASGKPVDVAAIALSPAFLAAYELGRHLGSGAMGMVCQATQRSTGRAVAVKFLARAADGDLLARFEREGRVLARIAHPAVLRVFDVGEIEGHPFLVTELLEGGSLRERIRGPMPWAAATAIAASCLEGLGACHEARVIHRDLKPENILFDAQGNPKVADLGIAHEDGDAVRLTATGALIGTPTYMAPEQLLKGVTGVLSDVWAMAAVLYEMIAGKQVHAAKSLVELLVMSDQPAPPLDPATGAPAPLVDLLARALDRDPARRPLSARAMAQELTRILAPEAAPVARARRSTARSFPVSSAAASVPPARAPRVAAAFVALGLAACGAWWFARRPPPVVPPAASITSVAPRPSPAVELPIGLPLASDTEVQVRFDGPPDPAGIIWSSPSGAILIGSSMGMSADGARLWTTMTSGIRIWGVPARQLLASIYPGQQVRWAALDATGARAAFGTESRVFVVALGSRRVYSTPSEGDSAAGAFEPHANGLLVSGANAVRRIDLTSGATTPLSPRSSASMLRMAGRDLAISPDGQRAACLSYDRLELVDLARRTSRLVALKDDSETQVATGISYQTIAARARSGYVGLEWTGDSQRVWVGHSMGALREFDAIDGKELRKESIPGGIASFRIERDAGRILITTGRPGQLGLSRAPLQRPREFDARMPLAAGCRVWLPEGGHSIAIARGEGTALELVDLAHEAPAAKPIDRGRYRAWWLPDSRRLLVQHDGALTLWDVPAGKQLQRLELGTDGPTRVRAQPGGRCVAMSVDADGMIMVDLDRWSLDSTHIDHAASITSVDLAPDGSSFAVADPGQVSLYARNFAVLRRFPLAKVEDVFFDPAGRLLGARSRFTVQVNEVASGRALRPIHLSRDALAIGTTFDETGKFIGSDAELMVSHEVETGHAAGRVRESATGSLNYAPARFVCAPGHVPTGTVLSNRDTGEPYCKFPEDIGDVPDAAVSPDGQLLVLAGDAGVRVWRISQLPKR